MKIRKEHEDELVLVKHDKESPGWFPAVFLLLFVILVFIGFIVPAGILTIRCTEREGGVGVCRFSKSGFMGFRYGAIQTVRGVKKAEMTYTQTSASTLDRRCHSYRTYQTVLVKEKGEPVPIFPGRAMVNCQHGSREEMATAAQRINDILAGKASNRELTIDHRYGAPELFGMGALLILLLIILFWSLHVYDESWRFDWEGQRLVYRRHRLVGTGSQEISLDDVVEVFLCWKRDEFDLELAEISLVFRDEAQTPLVLGSLEKASNSRGLAKRIAKQIDCTFKERREK